MHIVLLGGADPRFLGGSARARNTRVAERIRATVSTPATLLPDVPGPVILVPPGVALTTALFADKRFVRITRELQHTWADSTDGGAVAVVDGAAALRLGRDPAALAALPHKAVGGGAHAIDTAANRRRAARAVLLATGKASDGWVSRTVNRPVSRACSRAALFCGMSATGASIVTLLLGLLCAWTASQPGYVPLVVTGVLFQIASILDGVDGEIARATLTESASGARVDTIVDQVTYVACFAGAMVGWIRETGGTLPITIAAITGIALVLSLLRAGRFVSAHATNASFVFVDKAVRRAAADTGRLPLRLAAASFTLLRRDLFALIFLAASLTGVRVLMPALILAGIAIANLTFSFFSRELVAAAGRERADSALSQVRSQPSHV
jgi:phosphatidylserine synthase